MPLAEPVGGAGDPAVLVASWERARTELGWKPERADLTGIVRDAWEFTRSRQEA